MTFGALIPVLLKALPGAIKLLLIWLQSRAEKRVDKDVEEFNHAVATDDTAALERLLDRL